MRNFLNNLFNAKKPNKKNASTKLELLNLEARLTPSTAQPIVGGQGSLNDFTAVGADSGGGPLVTVTFNNTDTLGNGPQYLSFFAYDPSFTGGVRVALGDVNGDGNRDIITAAGPSGAPHIKVFTLNLNSSSGDWSVNPQPISQFYAFNQPTFKGGVYIAAGDTNNDGFDDIICGAGATGGPRVTVYAGTSNGVDSASPLNNFFAYPQKFNGGVVVTAGQRNSNAGEEVIVAPASNAGYNIRSYDVNGLGSSPKLVDDFFAFNDFKSRGGLSIAAGNLDQGLGITDLVVGTTNNQFGVILNNEPTGIPVTNVFAGYNGTIRAGVARDANGQEVAVALAGPGGAPRVSIFTFQTYGLSETETAFVIPPKVSGGGTFSMFGNPTVGYFTGGLFGAPTL
ncbi:MAG: VCBS repeat-containing protein [Planctomycetes bacterium]|nr:VCBS repeat-containing protein [Planctomycetota bacterium]NBY01506.1 VCBS repeat-containing protein [Planctomycetota bacterium]